MNIETDVIYNDLIDVISRWKTMIPPGKFGLLQRRLYIIRTLIIGETKQTTDSPSRYIIGEFILKTLTTAEECGFNIWWRQNHPDDRELSNCQDTLFYACNVFLKDNYKKLTLLEKKISTILPKQKEICDKLQDILEKNTAHELNDLLKSKMQQFEELLLKIQYGYDFRENICSHRDTIDEAGILLIGVKDLKERIRDFHEVDLADEISKILDDIDIFLISYIESASISDDDSLMIEFPENRKSAQDRRDAKDIGIIPRMRKIPVKPFIGKEKNGHSSAEPIRPLETNILPDDLPSPKTNILPENHSCEEPVGIKIMPEVQSPQKFPIPIGLKSMKGNLGFSAVKELKRKAEPKPIPEKKVARIKAADFEKTISVNKDSEMEMADEKSAKTPMGSLKKIEPIEFPEEDIPDDKPELDIGQVIGIKNVQSKERYSSPHIASPLELPPVPEIPDSPEAPRLCEDMTMEEKLRILDDLTVDDMITDESNPADHHAKAEQSADADVFLDLGSIEGLPAELGMDEIKKILEYLGESIDDSGLLESMEFRETKDEKDKKEESPEKDEKDQKQKMEALRKLSSFLNEKLTNTQKDSLNASILEAKNSKRDYTSVIEHILSEMPEVESIRPGKPGIPGKKKIPQEKRRKSDDSYIVKGEEVTNKVKIRRMIVHSLIYLVLFLTFFMIMNIGVVANQKGWIRNYFAGGKPAANSIMEQSRAVENEIVSTETHYQIEIIGKIKVSKELAPIPDSEGNYTFPDLLIICYIPELHRQYEFTGKDLKVNETGDFRIAISIPKADSDKCPGKISLTVLHEKYREFRTKLLDLKKETATVYVPDIILKRIKINQ